MRTSKSVKYFLLPALVALASFMVYSNALSNGFVFDDTFQVLGNKWIKDVKYIPEIFTSRAWGFRGEGATNYYRPLMHLIYMLDYHLFGFSPAGFHLVNILVHAAVSVLAFFLLLRLAGDPDDIRAAAPAFLGALLFAVHPIHTEAVTWVAGIPELSFTFFYLLSFYLYVLAGGSRRPVAFVTISAASFFIALIGKETAVTLPLLIAAYDISYRRGGGFSKVSIKRYAPYLVAALAFFAMRFHAISDVIPAGRHAELEGVYVLLNAFPLISHYLVMLLFPVNLNGFHVLHPVYSIAGAAALLSLLAALFFCFFLFLAYKKDRRIFLGLFIVMLPLLPVLYIPALGENTFAERYLYLPSFGFVFLVSLVLGRIKDHRAAWQAAALLILACAFLYGSGTVQRNKAWKDGYTFWTDILKKSPDSDAPHLDLGVWYESRGMYGEAVEQYREALRLKPGRWDIHLNLGAVYFKKGWTDGAIEEYEKALSLNPDYAEAHFNLGMAFRAKGLPEEAEAHYKAAIAIKPTAEEYINLGVIYARAGRTDEAVEQYRLALGLEPSSAEALFNLGAAYLAKGMPGEAAYFLEASLKVEPGDADAHNNLGIAYADLREMEKAARHFEAAVRLDPGNRSYRENLQRVIDK